MKFKLFFTLILPLIAPPSFAATLNSMAEADAMKFPVSQFHSAETIYNDGSNIVRAIVLDHGLGTDMSARYQLIVTVNSYGEMLNLGTAFDLGPIYDFLGVMNQSGPKFSILYRDYDPELHHGMIEKMFNVDARKAIEAAKNQGRGDFEDGDYSSSIEVENVIPN